MLTEDQRRNVSVLDDIPHESVVVPIEAYLYFPKGSLYIHLHLYNSTPGKEIKEKKGKKQIRRIFDINREDYDEFEMNQLKKFAEFSKKVGFVKDKLFVFSLNFL